MGNEQIIDSESRVPATDDAAGIERSIAGGIAQLAGSLAALPAVRTASMPEVERGRVAASLADGWNLAAFVGTGALVLDVVDAAGARIEVIASGGGWGRGGRDDGADRHEARCVRAAWGAPPGRRITAMGMVPGPGGIQLRASCGLILRIPAVAITDPLRTAALLVFHSAMYAAERCSMPVDAELATVLGRLADEHPMPQSPVGRVAWADGIVDRLVEELGGIDGPASVAPALREQDSHV